MTLEEANAKLSETDAYIYQTANGQYRWSALMWESAFAFDTVEEAYNEAADYINRGGY